MALVALLALALVLRLVVGHAIGVIETDGVRYITIARQFQATGNPFDPLISMRWKRRFCSCRHRSQPW